MADITTGLIAHWRLNEGAGTTAADELGHAQGHSPALADLSGFATY